jgi:2'-5' RNA ligase
MKDTIRLFAAAILPPDLKAELQELTEAYKEFPVRLLPQQNLHLTLYFIGNVPLDQLSFIKETIRTTAQQQPPFILDLACLEAGPNLKSPRLIWARFANHTCYDELSKALTQALSPEPPKKLQPIPHITLARFRKEPNAPKHLPVLTPDKKLQLEVNEVALWHSELASPHPIYTILETYPLLKTSTTGKQ